MKSKFSQFPARYSDVVDLLIAWSHCDQKRSLCAIARIADAAHYGCRLYPSVAAVGCSLCGGDGSHNVMNECGMNRRHNIFH